LALLLPAAAFAAAPATTPATPTAASAPAPGAEVFVPSLWDPASPPPKPDPAALKPLLVITGEDDPPFDFNLPDGTPAGFNADLARAVCNELKVACTVQTRRWETIRPALAAGAGDVAVASLSITEAALRDLDFTSPYYRTPARFVAQASAKVRDVLPDTVAGRRVGVAAGTAHEAYLRAFFPAAAVVPYPTAAALRAALASGAVDLAFGDGIAFAGWLNGPVGGACCAFAGGAFLRRWRRDRGQEGPRRPARRHRLCAVAPGGRRHLCGPLAEVFPDQPLLRRIARRSPRRCWRKRGGRRRARRRACRSRTCVWVPLTLRLPVD